MFFFFLYRAAFVALGLGRAQDFSWPDFFKALYLGLKFDLRLALIVSVIPFLPLLRKYKAATFLIVNGILFFCYLFDFGHYLYLGHRMSVSIVEFAENPAISFGMVWESYPVILLGLLGGAGAVGLFWVAKRLIFFSQGPRKKSLTTAVVAVFFWLGGVYGKLSWPPLHWSEAFFSQNSFLCSLALNPVLYFLNSLALYREYEKTHEHQDKLLSYHQALGKFLKRDAPLPKERTKRSPNIVMIILESQAAFMTGAMGSTIDPTPHLDALARESLFYKNFFIPTQATARSMFTLLTGWPDVSVVKTAMGSSLRATGGAMINSFKEYEKLYFLGGSASWGNVRGLLAQNVEGLKIYEEGDFPHPKLDVWGISDYHLLIEANKVFKKQKSPFLAIVQTAGFHRPYSLPPEGQGGDFKVKKLHPPSLYTRNGFSGEKEYNSLRWQDYALGNFMKQARQAPYFEDTLFVIYGDHGLGAYQVDHVSRAFEVHDLANLHVPLLFYGPKWVTAREEEQVMGLVDLWPTLLGLLGRRAPAIGLGRDLSRPAFQGENQAFVYYWYTFPPKFGLIQGHYFYKDNLQNFEALYDLSSQAPGKNIAAQRPDLYTSMKHLARGIYYASKARAYKKE